MGYLYLYEINERVEWKLLLSSLLKVGRENWAIIRYYVSSKHQILWKTLHCRVPPRRCGTGAPLNRPFFRPKKNWFFKKKKKKSDNYVVIHKLWMWNRPSNNFFAYCVTKNIENHHVFTNVKKIDWNIVKIND